MNNFINTASHEVKSCDNMSGNMIGPLIGAFLTGFGLFLVGSPTSCPITRIIGLIFFLTGIIIFAY